MKKSHTFTLAAIALTLTLHACSGLSSRAKQMTGDYYLPSVSENEPVMELNPSGKCVLHAIKPDVMSYTVEGKWNVKDDSLIIKTEGKAQNVTGDTTVVRVGNIPTHISYFISDFNEHTLTLQRDGNDYVYSRRGHRTDLEPIQ